VELGDLKTCLDVWSSTPESAPGAPDPPTVDWIEETDWAGCVLNMSRTNSGWNPPTAEEIAVFHRDRGSRALEDPKLSVM